MRAFVISEIGDVFDASLRDVEERRAHDDDVLVRIEFSGVNFKDAMVASPQSRVRRTERLVGGVDAAGVVVSSPDPTLLVGTRTETVVVMQDRRHDPGRAIGRRCHHAPTRGVLFIDGQSVKVDPIQHGKRVAHRRFGSPSIGGADLHDLAGYVGAQASEELAAEGGDGGAAELPHGDNSEAHRRSVTRF